MARTRGVSHRFHQDDGVLLGKGGVPIPIPRAPAQVPLQRQALDRQGNAISPAAYQIEAPRRLSGNTVLHGPGAEPVKPPGTIIAWRADNKSVARSIEAWDLFLLLDLMLGGMHAEVTPEAFISMPGDLRRHFVAIRQNDTILQSPDEPPTEIEAA